MYSVITDTDNKIVYLEFSDYISINDALQASKEFDEALQNLQTEFYIVCDISTLKSCTRSAKLVLQKSMRKLNAYPIKKIIRIVNNYDGAILFDRAQLLANASYQVVKLSSKEKALSLTQLTQTNPPIFQKHPSIN